MKLEGELITLYGRKERGENVDLVIRNKEERKAGYERSLKELKEQIQKEQSLTMGMPRFIGIIRVKPEVEIDKAMQSDPEVERIGMKVAMSFEADNGRTPKDVSAENLGFDIRSADTDNNVRYIEVKSRAETGAVALTQNEWFKARRFREEYWLYIVVNAATNPILYTIINPAENLNVQEKVEVVRFLVPLEEWKSKGVRV